MKIQLETITTSVERSFSLMYNPRLSDLFFWHFHPELELVFIKNATGTRHVGDHISTYKESDLVLIGSNIPHLNFDYGVNSAYSKVVVHLQFDFVQQLLQTPELANLYQVFEWAKYGVVFNGAAKLAIGEALFAFESLSSFQQYLRLIEILNQLANWTDIALLHDKPYARKYHEREQGRLRTIYAFIDKNYHQKIELQEIASLSNMTKEAFCRYFKKATGSTFIQFLNRYRISQSKRLLMSGESVSEACYRCGFESLSYYNRIFKKITNENPSTFRKRYL